MNDRLCREDVRTTAVRYVSRSTCAVCKQGEELPGTNGSREPVEAIAKSEIDD